MTMTMTNISIVILASALVSWGRAALPLAAADEPIDPKDAIWIEGERPSRSDVARHPWWYDKVKTDVLSGGEWISNFSKEKEGIAEYELKVLVADTYVFWIRANPQGATLSRQLDGGEWTAIDLERDQRGRINIAGDGEPDLRFLAWVKAGTVKLGAGTHTLALKMHSENNHHGGVDCFAFTRIPFTPSGTTKPGVRQAAAGPGDWFAVIPDDDSFSKDSVIDMTRLLEAPAGKHGFLRRDGSRLRFEKAAEPTKFWGLGANIEPGRMSSEDQKRRARYLAKHGVNMVRVHPVFDEVGPLRDGRLDPKRLDALDVYFAALKEQGIYSTWSLFYPYQVSEADGYAPELFRELEVKDARRGLRGTYGLINFERKLQDLALRYVKALLEHRNPYTGLRYRDDPALAVLEIQNEDCVFFHFPLGPLQAGKQFPLHSKRLRERWCAWVKARYRSDAAVKAAWGSLRGHESLEKGELDLMGAFHLGGGGPLYEFQGQALRAGDFIRFLAEIQREYYTRREKEVRHLGFKGVTVTTAWRSGGAAADPANLWCDTAADMIDRHNYLGGGEGGHGIKEGKVHDTSHLTQPGRGLLATGLYQVDDRPFSMTEWTQLPPNEWKLEAAPLVAFYGMGLQGWDASYHFLQSGVRLGDGWPRESSYVSDTPHYMGQFPALAFALRHGHIAEAPVIAARRLKLDDLFTGKDALEQDFTAGGHDVKSLKDALGTPVEALAIGRVTVAFGGGVTEKKDLSPYWDAEKRIVKSATGELAWDYGRQVVTLSAPRTQAIIGRAGGRKFDLPGVTATVKTPFVSLILTPLDDQPLDRSKQVLITAMARDRQTGTLYSEDRRTLLAKGGPPLLMEPVEATLKLSGSAPAEVRALDIYGVPTPRRVPVAADGAFVIDGRYQTYYYEVKR